MHMDQLLTAREGHENHKHANYQDLRDLIRSGPDANERYYVSDSPDANESSSQRLGPSRSDADRNAQRCKPKRLCLARVPTT